MIKKITNFIIFLILVSTVFGVIGQITNFDNEDDPFDLNLIANVNIFKNLSLPMYALFNNISFSINSSIDNDPIYDDRLHRYYPLDEITGFLVLDESGTQNGSRSATGSHLLIGKEGKSLYSYNDSVSLSSNAFVNVSKLNFHPDNNFTMCEWYKKPDTFATDNNFWGYVSGSKVLQSTMLSSGKIETVVGDGTVLRLFSKNTENSDEWKYKCITYEYFGGAYNVNLSLYINGSFDNSTLGTIPSFYADINMYYFGRNVNNAYGRRFRGSIDEISIWNRTLNGSEIEELYNSYDGKFYNIRISNLTLEANQSIAYNRNENFLSSNISTDAQLFNSILRDGCSCSNCTLIESNCTIPVSFRSSTSILSTVSIENISYEFGIDNCSTFTNPILNLTYYDELTNAPIDVNIGYDLTFTGGFVHKINATSTNTYSDSFCTNMDSTQRNLNYNVTGQITLSKTGYGTRINNYDLSNAIKASNNPVNNFSFFLINLTDSSTIIYSVSTTSLQPIDGTLLIFQCSGDGSRTQVSSTPITNGRASDNVELINTPYSYDVVVNGVLFQDFNSYGKCRTEPSETRRILVEIDPVDFSPEAGLNNIRCNLTKTGVNTVLMSWGSNPNDASTITGCLTASRFALGTYTEFWTNCSTTGSIERTIPANSFSYLVDGKIYQSGLSVSCDTAPVEFIQDQEVSTTFGLTGLFSVILLVISMMLVFSGKGAGMLLGIGIGLFVAFFLGLTAFGWATISGILLLLIVVAWIGRVSKK